MNGSRYLGLSAAQAAIAIIAVATLFRFFYATWLPMLPDETYYFQWSRHLDASYFSKGPAVAYTIWAGTKLLGDNSIGVRFFAVLLSAGTAWQLFLLARRWFDDATGLIAVLIAGVIPLYAVGAVLMTIDPLSAFFWVWAANFFSRAVQENRLIDWIGAGFAVGSGFLAKYLNALELIAFLSFVLAPARRGLLRQRGFWLMLLTAVICTLPVVWWNGQHGWASAEQLGKRGHLDEHGHFQLHTFINFLGNQAGVVSPLLFLALLAAAFNAFKVPWLNQEIGENEGIRLLLALFLVVFLFYTAMSFHIRCEPNWPAVSYLSLIVLLAAFARTWLNSPGGRIFLCAAFLLGWAETFLLHNTALLPLPKRIDPLERVAGWSSLAGETDRLQKEQHADVLLADGYKEASVISFNLPGKRFVYVMRHDPPANQYDYWPWFSQSEAHRVLWVTDDKSLPEVRLYFARAQPVESVQILFRGQPLRTYRIYLCEAP